MNLIWALLLGVVQGLAEFIPVSSSGHLVLIQSFIPNFFQPGVTFDVILHFGTILSVLVYFRKKLLSYLNIRFLSLLVVASIPAALVGFFFKDKIEILFQSVKFVGFALLLTGTMNLLVDKLMEKGIKLNFKNSFVIGVFQALAILPGISRSGATIFAGVKEGIDKKEAAEFSFILSILAVFGANFLEVLTNYSEISFSYLNYIVGFLAAFLTGIVGIKLVFRFIQGAHFEYFAYYCFILGFLVILFG
jgi:undecaprenyl-diphosphatase